MLTSRVLRVAVLVFRGGWPTGPATGRCSRPVTSPSLSMRCSPVAAASVPGWPVLVSPPWSVLVRPPWRPAGGGPGKPGRPAPPAPPRLPRRRPRSARSARPDATFDDGPGLDYDRWAVSAGPAGRRHLDGERSGRSERGGQQGGGQPGHETRQQADALDSAGGSPKSAVTGRSGSARMSRPAGSPPYDALRMSS